MCINSLRKTFLLHNYVHLKLDIYNSTYNSVDGTKIYSIQYISKYKSTLFFPVRTTHLRKIEFVDVRSFMESTTVATSCRLRLV